MNSKVKAALYFAGGVIVVNAIMVYLSGSKVPVASTVAQKAGF